MQPRNFACCDRNARGAAPANTERKGGRRASISNLICDVAAPASLVERSDDWPALTGSEACDRVAKCHHTKVKEEVCLVCRDYCVACLIIWMRQHVECAHPKHAVRDDSCIQVAPAPVRVF